MSLVEEAPVHVGWNDPRVRSGAVGSVRQNYVQPHERRDALCVHPVAQPLITLLPSIYQEEPFTNRWLAGFDEVIAPIEAAIDCFSAYLDPALSPIDFVAWISRWFGIATHIDVSDERLRLLVANAVSLFGKRGTASGLRELIELTAPVSCEVIEGGGVSSSTIPGSALPGSATGAFIVRVSAREALAESTRDLITSIVESSRPAHLPAVVEFAAPTTAPTPAPTATSSTAVPNPKDAKS